MSGPVPSSGLPSSSRSVAGFGRGVYDSPGGLASKGVAAISALVVMIGSLVFFFARGAFEQQLHALLAQDSLAVTAEEVPASSAAISHPQQPSQRVAVPKAPAWSLLQVSESVQKAAPSLQTLIAEGRSELPDFEALGSRDEARSARAGRQWAAWGRIWLNRVAVLEKALPPEPACAVHASMEPACATMRSSLSSLRAISEASSLDEAEQYFAQSEQILDQFLNPPVPDPPPEETEPDQE